MVKVQPLSSGLTLLRPMSARTQATSAAANGESQDNNHNSDLAPYGRQEFGDGLGAEKVAPVNDGRGHGAGPLQRNVPVGAEVEAGGVAAVVPDDPPNAISLEEDGTVAPEV